jgi:FtsP/CotA-like multicopper oxidase with cupredoxin domain
LTARGVLVLVVALLACAGCTSETIESPESGAPDAIQPPGWDDRLRLVELPDLDPAPNVVRVELEARISTVDIGAEVPARDVWTYGGTLPGPLIHAKVGDRLIIDFRNSLPEATTIHWHGMRVPAPMDGVPDHSQPAIAPGARFTYDFVVPDAGLFWYHPHLRSAVQVGFGLYGAIAVDDPNEAPLPGEELILVLSDLSLDADGRPTDPNSGGDLGILFGREGSFVLANGKVRPVLQARAGAPLRLRIVNAAISRYFQLELEGHRFSIYGADAGRMSRAIEVDRLLVIPGERREVSIVPRGEPGAELVLRWIPYDRGFGSTEFRDPEDVVRIELDRRPPVATPPIPSPAREIAPIDTTNATSVDLSLTQMNTDTGLVLGINGVPYWEAEAFMAHVGETQVWSIENEMNWAHPFHLHGFLFQVLEENGRPLDPLALRDTVDVPIKGRAKFAVRYDDRPGMWMFHCHILDHADAGMMGMLHVHPLR